ncbi:IS110 family transposase [Amycolatopsis sp. cmx-4-68]|uniref:IS110 family transposase n=1 Tax=Amycolatopsis sp. cmx-4-68 TaxID=2790938 RepID=UPI00397C9A59
MRKFADDQAAGEVRRGIDPTSNAAALLVATGQQIRYVPGRVVNRMTGVFRGESETDAKDARVIDETARLRTDLTPVAAIDDPVIAPVRLSTHREDLAAD